MFINSFPCSYSIFCNAESLSIYNLPMTITIKNHSVRFLQPNLIKAAGYPSEKHRVTTEDGYVLQMHRIPAGRRSARRSGDPNAKGKKAILAVHGLVGSSGDFVIMGPERSLGKKLCRYNITCGRNRLTIYRKAHSLVLFNINLLYSKLSYPIPSFSGYN